MNPFKYPGTDNRQKAPEQGRSVAPETADLHQQYSQVVDLNMQNLARALQYYPRPVSPAGQPAPAPRSQQPAPEAVTTVRRPDFEALNPLLAAAHEAVERAFEAVEGVNEDVQEAA